jgi:hypothetical protein
MWTSGAWLAALKNSPAIWLAPPAPARFSTTKVCFVALFSWIEPDSEKKRGQAAAGPADSAWIRCRTNFSVASGSVA